MLVTQIAEAEGIGRSQACRVLRLTLFAPDIVERILDARLEGPDLAQPMKPLPPVGKAAIGSAEQSLKIGGLDPRRASA